MPNRLKFPGVAFFLAITLAAIASTMGEGFRTWTDVTGRYQTEAELIEVNGPDVHLRKRDGVLITVPVEKLSDSDRRFIQTGLTPSATLRLLHGKWAPPYRTADMDTGEDITTSIEFREDGNLRISVGRTEIPAGTYKLLDDKNLEFTLKRSADPNSLTIKLTILSVSATELVVKADGQERSERYVKMTSPTPDRKPAVASGLPATVITPGRYRLTRKVYKVFWGKNGILIDSGRDDEVEVFHADGQVLLKIAENKFLGGVTSEIVQKDGYIEFTGTYSRDPDLLFRGTVENGTVTGTMTGTIRGQIGRLNSSEPWAFTLAPIR